MHQIFIRSNIRMYITVILCLFVINGYTKISHIEKCCNLCATKFCGMKGDVTVFRCIRDVNDKMSGYVDFNLSDEDKLKLPECYKVVNGSSLKFEPNKNTEKFEECLRFCKVELLNWCQP